MLFLSLYFLPTFAAAPKQTFHKIEQSLCYAASETMAKHYAKALEFSSLAGFQRKHTKLNDRFTITSSAKGNSGFDGLYKLHSKEYGYFKALVVGANSQEGVNAFLNTLVEEYIKKFDLKPKVAALAASSSSPSPKRTTGAEEGSTSALAKGTTRTGEVTDAHVKEIKKFIEELEKHTEVPVGTTSEVSESLSKQEQYDGHIKCMIMLLAQQTKKAEEADSPSTPLAATTPTLVGQLPSQDDKKSLPPSQKSKDSSCCTHQ